MRNVMLVILACLTLTVPLNSASGTIVVDGTTGQVIDFDSLFPVVLDGEALTAKYLQDERWAGGKKEILQELATLEGAVTVQMKIWFGNYARYGEYPDLDPFNMEEYGYRPTSPAEFLGFAITYPERVWKTNFPQGENALMTWSGPLARNRYQWNLVYVNRRGKLDYATWKADEAHHGYREFVVVPLE